MSNKFEVLGLYEHNERAYRKVKEAFESGEDIVGIVHATGTGKSYIALQLAYDNKDKKTLFIVPSNSIIEHLKGIIEANPNLSIERDFSNLKFVTYQSFVNMSKEEMEALNYEMMVLDEFHHIGAPIWGQRIEMLRKTHPTAKVFGMTAYTVRDRNTAYERDMANPDGNELFSNKIVSTYDLCDAMIEGILPKPIYKSAYIKLMNMAEELEKKVFKLDRTSEEYRLYINIIENAKKQIHKAANIGDIIKKYVKSNGKYIYFCPQESVEGINDIETIKKEALKWFKEYVAEEDIIFYTSLSEMGVAGEKNRNAFYNDTTLDGQSAEGKLRIMFAINQYNEGIHTPNIDGVIMGRTTESDIVYFEQLGRALSVRGDTKNKIEEYMKYSEDELIEVCKKQSIKISENLPKEEIIQLLIAPTVIDLANNLKFIKQLENKLKDKIKQATNKSQGQKQKTRKIILKDASFNLEIANAEIYEELRYVLDRLTMTWDDKYELARAYYETHGNLLIPIKFKTINGVEEDETGVSLGVWISSLRNRFKNGTLSQEKIEKLEDIGMIWSVKLSSDKYWDIMYQLAEAFYKANNNLSIPLNFKTNNGVEEDETGVSLGVWIGSLRKAFKNGKLSQDRIKKLEAIGMVWNTYNGKWDAMYQLAKAYYETYGDLLVPIKFKTINGVEEDETGVSLGTWIGKQRVAFNSDKLSQDKIDKLETLGMIWNSYDSKWDAMYQLAKAYYETHGNLLIPANYKTNNGVEEDETGVSLGNWIGSLRTTFKNGILSQEKIEKLEDIGIVWDTYNNKWDAMYQLAKAYYETYGDLLIPKNFKTVNGIEQDEKGLSLENWIKRQRTAYQKGKLSKDKIEKLEDIGMIWNLRKKRR